MSSEKANSVITHLVEVIAIRGIPVKIKADNAPAYVSSKVKQFLVFYNVKHITSRAYNPTGYSVVERSNHTFKMLI